MLKNHHNHMLELKPAFHARRGISLAWTTPSLYNAIRRWA